MMQSGGPALLAGEPSEEVSRGLSDALVLLLALAPAPSVPIVSGAVQYLSSKFHFGLSSLSLWLIRECFLGKSSE